MLHICRRLNAIASVKLMSKLPHIPLPSCGRGLQLFGSKHSSFASTADNCNSKLISSDHKHNGPSLRDFIKQDISSSVEPSCLEDKVPYLLKADLSGGNRRVFIETYGCQMNENDTEIAWSILHDQGYVRSQDVKHSDVILIMTCSIREGAEQKVWKRLEFLRGLKKARLKAKCLPQLKIGILGCMAERLKTRLLDEEKSVDVVCGPDAYRDLPRLLALTESSQTAVNVLLSIDETYADVLPVRTNINSRSAFVSVMRGCNNMCSYCIVPFTRGRERSRPIESIVEEIKVLSEQGYREVTLLGQNVNSYCDVSSITVPCATQHSRGFSSMYRPPVGGRRFSELLSSVAKINPEMRIRFTSPHPKDFPDELLYVIRDEPNVCRQIHLPAQSGSNRVLGAMRRGYTAEAYIQLVQHICSIIPDVSLSSDFIAGFCGETEEDHQQTLALIRNVKYNFAFCFPYSLRQKTHASHHLVDDVCDDIKKRRHSELIIEFRQIAKQLNCLLIGQRQVVLVEQDSKKSRLAVVGRNEAGTKVVVEKTEIPISATDTTNRRHIEPGDYITVQINDATSQVLKAIPLYHTTLTSATNGSKTLQRAVDD